MVLISESLEAAVRLRGSVLVKWWKKANMRGLAVSDGESSGKDNN